MTRVGSSTGEGVKSLYGVPVRQIPVWTSEGKKFVTEEEFWKLRDTVPQSPVVEIPNV